MCSSRIIDDSHNDDLILSNKREIDALNTISGFRDALFANSPLRVVFSGGLSLVLPSRFIFKMLSDCVLRPAISLGR
jgi:hypothetical protein